MEGTKKSCMLCDNDYDEKEKKPLMLPCGHSFCKECFDNLSSATNHLCPVCRMDWSELQVDSLPVCYQLLPEQGANDPFLCLKHKTHMTIWCSSCKLRICLDCCWHDHLKCSWKPVKKAVADLLDDIGLNTNKVQKRLLFWESHVEKLSRFSRQLINALTENLSELRVLEEVAKMMEFYSRNIDNIREQIKRSQCNLQLLRLDNSEEDVLAQLVVLEEKMAMLDHLGKEPDWPQVPRNSFLRIMDSLQVLRGAFDQLAITLNEFQETDTARDVKTAGQLPKSANLVSESDVANENQQAKPSAETYSRKEEEFLVGIALEREAETLRAHAGQEAGLSEKSDGTEEDIGSVRSDADEAAELLMTNPSTNEEAAKIPPDHTLETDFSFLRLYISQKAEVSRTSNIAAESDVFTADDVPADLSSSLTLSQTSSTLISSLASSLRSHNHVDSHDPDLYFFKGILPDVKKLSSTNKMLFKHRILVRLNALLSGDPSS